MVATGEQVANVLMVCTGNRGRSPIAEAILRHMLAQRGLAGRVQVQSAGMCAYELDRAGLPADPVSAAVCASHGLDLSRHVARPLTRAIVERSTLVIVMETWQAKTLRAAFPAHGHKVLTLRELGGNTQDPDLADLVGSAPEAIEGYFAEAERCLRAGLNFGALAAMIGLGTAAGPEEDVC